MSDLRVVLVMDGVIRHHVVFGTWCSLVSRRVRPLTGGAGCVWLSTIVATRLARFAVHSDQKCGQVLRGNGTRSADRRFEEGQYMSQEESSMTVVQ